MKKTPTQTLLKTALIFIGLIILGISAFAQSGSIKGTVLDSVAQEPLMVTLELKSTTSTFTNSDIDGNFEFQNVDAGTYTIIMTSVGFVTKTVENVIVENDKVSEVNIFTSEEVQAVGDDATVTTQKISNSSRSVINETKIANQVVSGISMEQIKISQDRTAAQVMSRIPGVTVVDGKFIMVRGVPERYNQVLMNNAIAPSTEVDKRTFSFDLIPSNVLDRMMIYKSGAPENTGDFAGGLIKVYTANTVDENFTDISFSTGFRSGTTFGEYIQSQGSSTDAFGFDNGFRQLPSAFPEQNLRSLPNRSQKRVDAAKLLPNNFAPESSTALPDFGVGVSFGRSFYIGKKKVSTITALSYGQSFMNYDKSFNRYLEWDKSQKQAEQRFDYSDNYNEKDNRIGVISNWRVQFNPNSSIEFKNLFSQIGENTTVIRTGEDYIQQVGLQRENYMYQYRSRSVYSGQLEGKHDHKLMDKKAHLNWIFGMNYLGEDQPDLRRFRTIETATNSDEYRMVLPPSSNLYDAGRFYSKLNETGFSHSLNYRWDLGKNENNPIQLKAGYMLDYRSRVFDTRYFSYFYPGSSSLAELQRLERLPLGEIFNNKHLKTENGFLIEEGTRASDSYTASNMLTAGYAGLVLPLGDLTISGGFRIEYNVLKLSAANDAGAAIEVNSPILSPLAFLNTDYNITDKTKIRFAYYRAVNRPEFRELAPFLFYDYQFDAEKYGNPDLTTANIDNLDLRYEIYPRAGEAISIGGFYKRFTNPIETLILIRSESPAFSYQNAASAYSAGVELELRKSLKDITGSGFIDNLSVNLNAAYIKSEVDYGDNPPVGQETKRALQGQSPYIINAILNYADVDKIWNISMSYNVFGPRIFAVGSSLFPTIYEMPRHALDLTISKKIKDNWTVKFGIQDILNSQFRFYQDTDRNTKVDVKGVDAPIFQFQRGTLFNLSLSYKF